jgi:hypothetical protein
MAAILRAAGTNVFRETVAPQHPPRDYIDFNEATEQLIKECDQQYTIINFGKNKGGPIERLASEALKLKENYDTRFETGGIGGFFATSTKPSAEEAEVLKTNLNDLLHQHAEVVGQFALARIAKHGACHIGAPKEGKLPPVDAASYAYLNELERGSGNKAHKIASIAHEQFRKLTDAYQRIFKALDLAKKVYNSAPHGSTSANLIYLCGKLNTTEAKFTTNLNVPLSEQDEKNLVAVMSGTDVAEICTGEDSAKQAKHLALVCRAILYKQDEKPEYDTGKIRDALAKSMLFIFMANQKADLQLVDLAQINAFFDREAASVTAKKSDKYDPTEDLQRIADIQNQVQVEMSKRTTLHSSVKEMTSEELKEAVPKMNAQEREQLVAHLSAERSRASAALNFINIGKLDKGEELDKFALHNLRKYWDKMVDTHSRFEEKGEKIKLIDERLAALAT